MANNSFSKLLLAVSLLIVITGCRPMNKLGISNYPNDQRLNFDYKLLNGTYGNCPDTSIGRINNFASGPDSSLYCAIGGFHLYSDSWHCTQQVVKLNFLTEHKFEIKLFDNGNLIDSKIIRGKVKKGYFYSRPEVWILPFCPIACGHHFSRFRLGLSGDKLILDFNIHFGAFVVVAGNDIRGYLSSVHSKK